MIHTDDQEFFNEYFQSFGKISDDEVITECRARRNTGEWNGFHLRGKVFQRDSDDQVTHILNLIQDITERKAAEQEILNLNKTLLQANRELKSLNDELKAFTSVAANNYSETLRQLYLSTQQTNDSRPSRRAPNPHNSIIAKRRG